MKSLPAILLSLLAILATALTLQGITVNYNFDGDFNSNFSEIGDGDGTWAQVGGVAEFTTTSDSLSDKVIVWQTYRAPYTSDWTLSLDITIPSFYDTSLTDTDMGDEYLDVVLAVQHETMTDEYIATSGLTVSTSDSITVNRLAFGEFVFNDSVQFTQAAATASTTLDVMLSYNASLEQITASYGGGNVLYTLSVGSAGDPDWGMSSTDFFNIGVSATNSLEQVLAANPVSVDNLAAVGVTAIPEPGTVGLGLGLLALGVIGYRRKMA